MRNKRYIKEIGVIHSALLFVCSIFAVSGIMYASTSMVGLTIVSQEEYDMTSGTNLSGDIFSGYDLTGNIEVISTTGGTWTWNTGASNNTTGGSSTGNTTTGNNSTGQSLTGIILTGNNLTGNSQSSSHGSYYIPTKVIKTSTGTKKFIVADANTEKYNPPIFKEVFEPIGNKTGKNKTIKVSTTTKKDPILNLGNKVESEKYHGSAEQYMCVVGNVYFGHSSADLTPLQKAHNLIDEYNYILFNIQGTKNYYARRFFFAQIIVLY